MKLSQEATCVHQYEPETVTVGRARDQVSGTTALSRQEPNLRTKLCTEHWLSQQRGLR